MYSPKYISASVTKNGGFNTAYITLRNYQKAVERILGLPFKENCPDTRNSKVDDIIKRLGSCGITPVVVDPWASERDAMHEYGVTLTKLEDVKDADCVIAAVAHNEFRALSLEDIKKLYKDGVEMRRFFSM